MLQSIAMAFLEGIALIVAIACLVRLGGGKPTGATLATILASATMACSLQTGFGLPEYAFPMLCGVLIGPCVMLGMRLSSRHATRSKIRGHAE